MRGERIRLRIPQITNPHIRCYHIWDLTRPDGQERHAAKADGHYSCFGNVHLCTVSITVASYALHVRLAR